MIASAYRAPRGLVAVLAALVALGALAFVVGAAGAHPERAWAAYLTNLVYFFSVALGGILLWAIQRIIGARWGRPVARVHQAFSAFLPVGFLLLVVFVFLGAEHLYPWIHEPIEAKAAWLDLGFWRLRDIAVAAVLAGLGIGYMRLVLRPDLPGGAAGASDLVRRHDRLVRLSVIFTLLYALGMSILAWDLLMSLDPHWYSTMFPVIVFWGGLLGAIAWTILLAAAFGRALGVRAYMSDTTWHDLGKLLFAFGIFWAYINYSQLLVIWYGNLPEETGWLWERVQGPWRPVVVATVLCVWFVPFVGLLTRATKKHPPSLALFAALVGIGLWLERFYIVYPSVLKHALQGGHTAGQARLLESGLAFAAAPPPQGAAGASSTAFVGQAADAVHYPPLVFGLTEIGVTLGFTALFLLCFLVFAGRYPMVSGHDFLSMPDREDGHH
jgi:hypothetical protein